MEINNTEPDTALEDARRLEFTLRTREDIISKLMKDGKLPDDKADKSLLVSSLDGIDRTILARSRIKADTKIADSNTQTTNLIATLLGKIDPRAIKAIDSNSEIPTLGDVTDILEINAGETDIGTQTNSFEHFMKAYPNEQV